MSGLEKAIAALKRGGMAVVYDGDEREGEADLILHAGSATPEAIETLRRDAGGLICLALDGNTASALGLPFYSDMLAASNLPAAKMECTKTAYGDKPAFSLQVNSRGVFTGITDNDRSLTIRGISAIAGSEETRAAKRGRFYREFYSPGHVFLLIGRGIENRRGHTELSLELARRAGLSGAMVLCEMLGSGKALSKHGAAEYARKRGLPFIEGRELL
jgi:3,4-dihydroxy 2-butanone 4-phosphate synthase